MILALLGCTRPDPTTTALLAALTDADRLARFPDPPGKVELHGSWDRHQREEEHANEDRGWFEGERTFGGRTEHVLVDLDGPGAIVRTWSANPERAGTLRIRLDGAERPVVEEPLARWLAGRPGEPRGSFGRGHLSLLPVPFREHALVTVDENGGHGVYWQVETVTWPAGTELTSFRAWPRADGVEAALRGPPSVATTTVTGADVLELPPGPGAIRRLRVRGGGTLVATFDGVRTIELPLEDLESGPYDAGPWAEADGVLTARWTMPYASSARLELPGGELEADVGPWTWDDRSMHLHAASHAEAADTKDVGWFPMAELGGRGVYVGDVLAVDNPSPRWWGEGDDEVTVDGEVTHRGTGTEDWYGYAWCDTSTFSGPFLAKPRDDAAGAKNACEEHAGHSVQMRFRALDALPFERSLRVRFEVWSKDRATTLGLRGTAFWYAVDSPPGGP